MKLFKVSLSMDSTELTPRSTGSLRTAVLTSLCTTGFIFTALYWMSRRAQTMEERKKQRIFQPVEHGDIEFPDLRSTRPPSATELINGLDPSDEASPASKAWVNELQRFLYNTSPTGPSGIWWKEPRAGQSLAERPFLVRGWMV